MQRVLISRLSSLGDVVCSLPVAAAIKKEWPQCEVTWVVDPRFAGVVECCEAIDQVVAIKPKVFAPLPAALRTDFDAALDLQGLMKSALIVAKARAKQKLGFHWQREGAQFFSQRVIPAESSVHIVDQYLDVARGLGAEASVADFALIPRADDIGVVQSKLMTKGLKNRFIVINPGAAWASKRWPASHVAELVRLCQSRDRQVVLIGGKGDADRAVAEEVFTEMKRIGTKAIHMYGETTIRELIALISLSDAHVGGDTGSTHIAAALGKPAIGLYSITRPERSAPYHQIARVHYNLGSLTDIRPERVAESLFIAML